MARDNDPRAQSLYKLKREMGKLITAILILNTLSNTAGAAIAGAQAGILWGEQGVIAFSVLFTLLVLLFGEIIPKTLGVAYSRPISLAVTQPWAKFILVFGPLVNLGEKLAVRFSSKEKRPNISEEEFLSMAQIGTEEGTLDVFESAVIANVMELDDTLVRDILTPRVAVFMLPEDSTVGEIKDQVFKWKYTRVPVYSPEDPDNLTGYVLHRDIIKTLLAGDYKLELKKIKREIQILPDLTTVDKVLAKMFKKNDHICSLVDEHGSLAGIVTLEDIIEELIGTEIEDETDEESIS